MNNRFSAAGGVGSGWVVLHELSEVYCLFFMHNACILFYRIIFQGL